MTSVYILYQLTQPIEKKTIDNKKTFCIIYYCPEGLVYDLIVII